MSAKVVGENTREFEQNVRDAYISMLYHQKNLTICYMQQKPNNGNPNNEPKRRTDMEKAKGFPSGISKFLATMVICLGIFFGLTGCDNGTKSPDASATSTVAADMGTGTEKTTPHPLETLDITWPDPSEINQTARKTLSAENLKMVNESPVPVLVPSDPKMLKMGVMILRPWIKNDHWYAFSGDDDTAGWKMEGSAQVHRYDPKDLPEIPADSTIHRGGKNEKTLKIDITNNEIGWRASWMENGIFYGIIYGCSKCAEDSPEWMKGEKIIRQMAETAAYVGGKGKE